MSKKRLLAFVVILIHFIASIIVQLGWFINTVFSHDYTVKRIIVWAIIGIALTLVDYYACIRILGNQKILVPRIVHVADLTLAIPNVALWGYSFILDVVNSGIIKPIYSIYDIALIIGMILVDGCLVIERISIINRNR